MKPFISSLLSIAALVSLAVPARASKTLWTIDRENSEIEFKIKSMMVKTVTGRFTNFFGTVDYDGIHLDRAILDSEIHVDSLDTNNNKRDRHLLSKDFFQVLVFPTMTYRSSKIVVAPDGDFRIYGTLNMHGVSRNVTLYAHAPHAIDSNDKSVKLSSRSPLIVEASTSLDRKDFDISQGMTDRGGALVGDTVQINLKMRLDPTN